MWQFVTCDICVAKIATNLSKRTKIVKSFPVWQNGGRWTQLWVIHPFIHPSIHPSIHSFIHHSFVRSFVRSFVHSFCLIKIDKTQLCTCYNFINKWKYGKVWEQYSNSGVPPTPSSDKESSYPPYYVYLHYKQHKFTQSPFAFIHSFILSFFRSWVNPLYSFNKNWRYNVKFSI